MRVLDGYELGMRKLLNVATSDNATTHYNFGDTLKLEKSLLPWSQMKFRNNFWRYCDKQKICQLDASSVC